MSFIKTIIAFFFYSCTLLLRDMSDSTFPAIERSGSDIREQFNIICHSATWLRETPQPMLAVNTGPCSWAVQPFTNFHVNWGQEQFNYESIEDASLSIIDNSIALLSGIRSLCNCTLLILCKFPEMDSGQSCLKWRSEIPFSVHLIRTETDIGTAVHRFALTYLIHLYNFLLLQYLKLNCEN